MLLAFLPFQMKLSPNQYRASLVFSLQTWLAETPEQARKGGTPGYISVGMACEIPFLSALHAVPVELMLTYLSHGCCGGRLAFSS